jgi:putative glutamine amidotransferase
MEKRRPIVGIVCNRAETASGGEQRMGDIYALAVRDGAGALPLLIPAFSEPLAVDELVAACDGFLFTGDESNVAPSRYGAEPAEPGMRLDAARDAVSLPLIRAAVAAGRPVLCICRGIQELNVALGGTLHQAVHRVPGRIDHREPPDASPEVQFAPAHTVTVTEGGLLVRLLPDCQFLVNSLHGQGIDRLAPPLRAEAVAPDGQIEAVSLPLAPGFVLGVQWHPEWRRAENPVSCLLFSAFGAALAQELENGV